MERLAFVRPAAAPNRDGSDTCAQPISSRIRWPALTVRSRTFWSPDGRSLAFFAAGRLRRIELRGGAPVAICDVREGIGTTGTWGTDGRICSRRWKAMPSSPVGRAAALLSPC
jgi:hypothetical protein